MTKYAFVNFFFRIKSRICYFLHARHRIGYGIHSPYLYHLVSQTIDLTHPYYAFEEIEETWTGMLFAAVKGSSFPLNESDKSYISQILKSEKNEKESGRTIFGILNETFAQNVIVTNSKGSADIAYIAKAKPNANCFCFNRSNGISAFIDEVLKRLEIKNVSCYSGNDSSKLQEIAGSLESVDFALFNPSEDRDGMLKDFRICLNKKNESSIFVIRGIHESPDMERAWKSITEDNEVVVSMDLLSMGLIIFRKDLEKKRYIIRR